MPEYLVSFYSNGIYNFEERTKKNLVKSSRCEVFDIHRKTDTAIKFGFGYKDHLACT